MTDSPLRGLTWGHRRAIDPLRASATAFEAETGIRIDWQVRSLSAFEHQSLEEAAQAVDLIVYDHPHLGAIVRSGALRPLEECLATIPDALDPRSYIGPSLASYAMDDHLWAVPVDGATIHGLHQPDLLRQLRGKLPKDWSEAIAFMRKLKKAGFISLLAGRNHHPLLTLASLMANIGSPWPNGRGSIFHLDRDALQISIGLLDEALDASERAASLAADAIDVHERLANDPKAAYCPAVYGYAVYGEAGLWPHRLGFSPFPGPFRGPSGTAIGGAGVGITLACRDLAGAQAYVKHLATAGTQRDIFAANAGQPARSEAWSDPAIDVAFGGYFSSVRDTVEQAWMRPRFDGYSQLEQDLAQLLQQHFAGDASVAATVRAMMERADQVGVMA